MQNLNNISFVSLLLFSVCFVILMNYLLVLRRIDQYYLNYYIKLKILPIIYLILCFYIFNGNWNTF